MPPTVAIVIEISHLHVSILLLLEHLPHFSLTTSFRRCTGVAELRFMHRVDWWSPAAISGPVSIVRDTMHELSRRIGIALISAWLHLGCIHCKALFHDAHEILRLGIGIVGWVVDVELVAVCTRPREGNLQGGVQLAEARVGRDGEGTPDLRVSDFIWVDLELENVVRAFAGSFVRQPVGGLTFFGTIYYSLAATAGQECGLGFVAGAALSR